MTALTLTLLVRDGHFTSFSPNLPAVLPTSLPADVDGLMIPSQPVEGTAPFRLRRHGAHLLYVPRRYHRHWVVTEGPHDAYVAGFSGKTRSTLRRKVRKFLGEAGDDAFHVYRTPAEMDTFHELARTVSALTYQERLMDAGLPDDDSFRAQMRKRASRGAARGYILMHQGRPVAYTYCPIDDGVALYAYTGFDPGLRSLSPGTVLQWLLLEDLFATPDVRMFDFTQGDSPHKELFSTHKQECADLYVLRPSLRIWSGITAQTGVENTVEAIGALLETVGLKTRLRRLLRGT